MANGNSFTATLKANSGPFKKGVDEAVTKLTELNKKLVDNQYQQKDCNKTISNAKKALKKLQEGSGPVSPDNTAEPVLQRISEAIAYKMYLETCFDRMKTEEDD